MVQDDFLFSFGMRAAKLPTACLRGFLSLGKLFLNQIWNINKISYQFLV